MTDKTTADATLNLARDLDAWVEMELSGGNPCVPDFWDECSTSERVAEYLVSIGYAKGDDMTDKTTRSPIETAPKDGTAILVGNHLGWWIAKYEAIYQSGYRPDNPWFSLMLNCSHMGRYPSLVPTHYMPLPEATR